MIAEKVEPASETPGGGRRIVLALQTTDVGGMESFCIDLAAEYTRRGMQVTALVPEPAPFDVVEQRFRTAGADVIRLDTNERGGRRAQAGRWLRVVRALRALHPDVVHVHVAGGTGGVATVATARLATRATVILSEHDVPPEHPSLRQRITGRIIDRAAHATVAVSRRNGRLRSARTSARAATFASVLNGVPIIDFPAAERSANRERIRAELSISPDALVVGCVVRLVQGKGLDDLLSAFAEVQAARACELVLVGDGPMRPELESMAARLGIGDRVHFAGRLAHPAPYFDAMDVFVLAVPAGSMSIALLEAMARGLPPIITFCGPEEAVINEESGLCAPPNDPHGLANVMKRMVEDDALRERLSAAAAAHVRRHFSIARVADNMLAIYDSARLGKVPAALRTDAPTNPRPGDIG